MLANNYKKYKKYKEHLKKVKGNRKKTSFRGSGNSNNITEAYQIWNRCGFFDMDKKYEKRLIEEVEKKVETAVKKAEKYIDNTFLVINSDCYLNIDLKSFYNFHNSNVSIVLLSLTFFEFIHDLFAKVSYAKQT